MSQAVEIDDSVIREHIPVLKDAAAVVKIDKGFSSDRKYFVYEHADKPAYVLRVAPFRASARKKREFDIVGLVHNHGVKTSEPIEFGTIEELGICWMVLRCVEGEDAADALPALTVEEQYQIGVTAGRELRFMHELEAPAELEPWHLRRNAKHRRLHDEYLSCGVKLPEEDAVLAFINRSLHLMEDRPNRFQHDDFHTNNLLVHNRQYAAAIDFNRYDWGDPFHDFFKIAYFSRSVSVPFSIGQITGYFDGPAPDRFWQLYALYVALNMLPSITWTLQVVPHQLDSMLERIRLILADHDNFNSVVPAWYNRMP
jgi:aminoglycoside phosphotransferase (APT) family kinase protein